MNINFNPPESDKNMLWFILWCCTVFSLWQGMLTGSMQPDGFSGWFGGLIMYCFVIFIVSLIWSGIAYAIGQLFDAKPIEGRKHKLAVIRDKDGVDGCFFLGSGFIQSEPYYFYYSETKNGGLRPGKLNADSSVTVYQENRESAELVEFDWKITYPSWAWLICMPDNFGSEKTYVFYVPEGTIKTGYSM